MRFLPIFHQVLATAPYPCLAEPARSHFAVSLQNGNKEISKMHAISVNEAPPGSNRLKARAGFHQLRWKQIQEGPRYIR